jgi:hypothetical protein
VELPAQMAHCAMPQDLWNAQSRFVQDMLSDYQSTAGRMMRAWGELITSAPNAMQQQQPNGNRQDRQQNGNRR